MSMECKSEVGTCESLYLRSWYTKCIHGDSSKKCIWQITIPNYYNSILSSQSSSEIIRYVAVYLRSW